MDRLKNIQPIPLHAVFHDPDPCRFIHIAVYRRFHKSQHSADSVFHPYFMHDNFKIVSAVYGFSLRHNIGTVLIGQNRRKYIRLQTQPILDVEIVYDRMVHYDVRITFAQQLPYPANGLSHFLLPVVKRKEFIIAKFPFQVTDKQCLIIGRNFFILCKQRFIILHSRLKNVIGIHIVSNNAGFIISVIPVFRFFYITHFHFSRHNPVIICHILMPETRCDIKQNIVPQHIFYRHIDIGLSRKRRIG